MKHASEFFIAACVGILVLIAAFFGLFDALNARLTDSFITPRPLSQDIIIVAIDDASLNELGQWPWDRLRFAQLLDAVAPYNPQAIAFDIIFAEPSRAGVADDQLFANAIARSEMPVIIANEATALRVGRDSASTQAFMQPLNVFIDAGALPAPTNIVIDSDGVARRAPLTITDAQSGISYSSFASVLVDGNSRVGIERIAYAQPTGGVRRISFSRALAEPELLADKIVLVGATAPSLHDEQQTPIDRGTVMPGVEIQANIVDMVLSGKRLNDVPLWLELILILCLALIPAVSFTSFRRSVEPLIACVIGAAVVIVGSNMAFDAGVVVPVGSMVVALVLSTLTLFVYRYAKNRKETRAIYDAFKRYVSPTVLKEILRHPERVVFGGEERMVTILFCDIRSFTTLSESMSATDLVTLLNRYFAVMSAEITATGGVIDKYIGDAIMAFWGAPLDDEQHATNAVRAAQGMMCALESFNKELAAEGRAPIAIGIGLASGPAVVGNIGSYERVDYTAMGDTVNTAARLEGLTKEYKQPIVISQKTKELVGDEFKTESLGEVIVKGKTVGVEIYGISVD